MAELSTLSICVLCGGSALFIIILVAFSVWKIKYDRRPTQSRRGAKPSASSAQTSLSAPPIPDSAYYHIGQDREGRPASTVDVGNGTRGPASEDANTGSISSFKPSATAETHERQQVAPPSSAVATEQTESSRPVDPATQSQAESTTRQDRRPDSKDNAATPSDMQEQHNYDNPATPTPVQSKHNATHQNEAATDYRLASPITETEHVSTGPSDTNNYSFASPITDTNTQPGVYFELERQVEYRSEDREETDGKTGTYFELEKQESGEEKEESLKSDAVENSNVYLEILP